MISEETVMKARRQALMMRMTRFATRGVSGLERTSLEIRLAFVSFCKS
jgi:hypothetical protein